MSYLFLIVTLIVGALQIDNLVSDKFKAKPWIILCLLVVVTVISFLIEGNGRREATKAKILAKQESDKRDHDRDSIADERIKKSNKEILTGIGDAIGKYSLGYDSAKKEITVLQQLIKDSSNRKTTIIEGYSPNLTLDGTYGLILDSTNVDTIFFRMRVCSENAPCIFKSGFAYFLSSTQAGNDMLNDLIYCGKTKVLAGNLGLAQNKCKDANIYTIRDNDTKSIKTIFVNLTGSYTDSNDKDQKQVDQVGYFDIATKKFRLLAAPYDDQIRQFLKNQKIIAN